jgi:AcrR family transcriptional regulator
MPKTARNAQEITGIRKRILTAALDIIVSEGFINLSMRNLASRLGMTAANIYNYFNNKDEIYILVRAQGFEMLLDLLSRLCIKEKDPVARIECFIRAYIDFGIRNPDYYGIMFNSNTPKDLDYAGSPIEEIAAEERRISSRVVEIAMAAVKDAVPCYQESEQMHHVIKLWMIMNGIVNLYNSNRLRDVNHQVENIIQRIIDETIESYRK